MKCLDTYTLIEIHDKNPNFIDCINQELVISEITMTEFYGILLRDYNEDTANYLLKKFHPFVVPVSFDILIKAVKYRHENKKQKLSFFDCVGYTYARENKIKFVTGDKEFENKPGVEFIKGVKR